MGQKPVLLVAFGVLPVRALLYTLTQRAGALVAIQMLDGLAAAIFGIASVLVIADLTKRSGRQFLPSAPSAPRWELGLRLAKSSRVPSCIISISIWAFSFLRRSRPAHLAYSTSCRRHAANNS
jgi:hypothetical protein